MLSGWLTRKSMQSRKIALSSFKLYFLYKSCVSYENLFFIKETFQFCRILNLMLKSIWCFGKRFSTIENMFAIAGSESLILEIIIILLLYYYSVLDCWLVFFVNWKINNWLIFWGRWDWSTQIKNITKYFLLRWEGQFVYFLKT